MTLYVKRQDISGNRFKKKCPTQSTDFEKTLGYWIVNVKWSEKMAPQGSTDSDDTMKGIPSIQDEEDTSYMENI
ncbi:hypothetical protein NPIL_407631 [Nephila pilipes]|uniref:Uncharacterized protein n=1 Tax=Nephila pilipes TaxID=299642 RepID=A0A8X6TVQ0_NEPPI|nr:hypothetical protein NPIL_407631 [Nephila pilipes]